MGSSGGAGSTSSGSGGGAASSGGGAASSGGGASSSSTSGGPLPVLGAVQTETFDDSILITAVGAPAMLLTPDDAPIVVYSQDGNPRGFRMAVQWNEQWHHQDLEENGHQPRAALDAQGRLHLLYQRVTENQFNYMRLDGMMRIKRRPDRQTRVSGMPTSHGIAVKANGDPVAVWYDGNEEVLRFGEWNGRNFVVEQLDAGNQVGHHARVAVGPDGAFHVAYLRRVMPSGLEIVYSVKRDGAWTTETIPGVFTSEVVLALGPGGEPHILNTSNGLKVFRRSGSSFMEVEVRPGSTQDYREVDMVVDDAGREHIAFICESNACGTTLDSLQYTRFNGTGWDEVLISDEGRYPAIALDGAYGAHVAYIHRTGTTSQRYLRYSHFNLTGPSFDSVTQMVGAAGGTVRSSDGILELDIPAGALEADTPISIQRVMRSGWPTGVDPDSPLPVYELLPDGTTFSTPATARYLLPPEGRLGLATPEGTQLVGGALASSSGTAERPTEQHGSAGPDHRMLEVPVAHFTNLYAQLRPIALVEVIQPLALIVKTSGEYAALIINSNTTSAANVQVSARAGTSGISVPAQTFDLALEPDGRAGVTFIFRCEDAGTQQLLVEVRHDGQLDTYTASVDCLPQPLGQAAAALGALLSGLPDPTQLAPERPDQHPEDERVVPSQEDHTEFQTVMSVVKELSQEQVDGLFNDVDAPFACNQDFSSLVVCNTNSSMRPGTYALFTAGLAAPPPAATPEGRIQYSLVINDGRPQWLAPVTAPADAYAGMGSWFNVGFNIQNQSWSANSLAVATGGTTTVPLNVDFRAAVWGDELAFFVPISALEPKYDGALGYRLVATEHTGNLGREPGLDFAIDVEPALHYGPASLLHGEIDTIYLSVTEATLEVITAADGSEAPNGETIFQELWMYSNATVTTGSPGVTPPEGALLVGVDFTSASGSSPGCVQQWDGTQWVDVDTLGEGYGRFRLAEDIPAGGCTAVLEARCTSGASGGVDGGTPGGGGGGIDCPMMEDPPTVTINGRHGSIQRFFIQTPDRICEDGEPTDFYLGRYGLRSGDTWPVGMAVDLYVCVQTSFGAWLRYDVFDDDNPSISWAGPPDPDPNNNDHSPRFTAGDNPNVHQGEVTGNRGGGSHGYIRVNYHPFFEPNGMFPQPDMGTITATGLMRSDTITLHKVGTIADGTGIASLIYATGPNVFRDGEVNSCTALTPDFGTGPVHACQLTGVPQRYDLWATVNTDTSGGTREIYVGTDERIGFPGSVLERRRIVTYDRTPFNSAIGINQLTGTCRGCSTPVETLNVATIGATPHLATITTMPQILMGVGASLGLVSTVMIDSQGQTAELDASWYADILPSNRATVGLYQPGFWTNPPVGLEAPRGTRWWAQVHALPVPSARSVDLTVEADRSPVSEPVTITVQP